MEIDLATSADTWPGYFVYHWANVPLEIYFCYDKNKITSIRDGNSQLWESSKDLYVKFLWVYSDLKERRLIDFIITSDPATITENDSTTSHLDLYKPVAEAEAEASSVGASDHKHSVARVLGSASTVDTDGDQDPLKAEPPAPPSATVNRFFSLGENTSTAESTPSGGNSAEISRHNTPDEEASVPVGAEHSATSSAAPPTPSSSRPTKLDYSDIKIAGPSTWIDGSPDIGFMRMKLSKERGRWIRVSRRDFYLRLDELYSLLPSLTSEKTKSTLAPTMDRFSLKIRPKFFAIDLDGTFLSFNSGCFVENLKAFERARQAGFFPLICTGRSFGSSFDGFNDLILEHTTYAGFPGVYNNGTVVFDHQGHIISKTTFSREYLTKLLAFIEESRQQCGFLFYDLENYYCLADPALVSCKLLLFYNFFKPIKIAPERLLDLEVVMIYYYKPEPDFGPFVNWVDHISKVTIYQLFTEIVPPGVSKSLGVRKLMDHYRLDPDSLFFVGDGENDIEIMKFLNNSFVVNDAPDFVKVHAKYILEKKHTQGAVARLLDRVFFGELAQ